MGLLRPLEWIFFIYFATHIPITICFDLQIILPRSTFPQVLLTATEQYIDLFKDNLMANPPVWYKSFVVCELFFQMPFFPIAAYAFYKGGCRWIRIPALVYGTHVTTTVIPIIAAILFADFTGASPPGPKTLKERLALTGIYSPYLLIPLMLVLTMLFNQSYTQDPRRKKKMY